MFRDLKKQLIALRLIRMCIVNGLSAEEPFYPFVVAS
jgi:hypothetical protein